MLLIVVVLIQAVTCRHVHKETPKLSLTDNIRLPNLPPNKDNLHINTPIDNIPIDNVPALTTKQLQLNLTKLTTKKEETQHHPVNWTTPFIPMQKARANLSSAKYQSNLEINTWVAHDYDKIQWDYLNSLKNANIVRCSLLRPFFNDHTCISCEPYHYFDFDRNKCVLAPHGTVHEPNTHNFTHPTRGYITNVNAMNIDLNGRAKEQVMDEYRVKKAKENLRICEINRPFFDGVTCINCIQPYPIFNLTSSRCTRCLERQEYSYDNRGCFDLGESNDKWTLPKALSNIITGI